jgi:hypothetical protein
VSAESEERVEAMTEVRAQARQIDVALGEALRTIAGLAQETALVPERGSLSIPFRAESPTLSRLLVDLATSLLDEIEARGEAISDLSVNGVLRTERGYTGWGYALLARGTVARLRPVAFPVEPTVTESVAGTAIAATVRVGAADAA